jgi:hypothetical protein
LVSNNATYFTLNSVTSGTRKTDWYGTVTINQPPSSVNKITINYDGKYSISRTQVLYLYNFVSSSWTQIDSRSVSTSDVSINKVQSTNVANFISSTGEIRLRVYANGGNNNFVCSGDWMQFIVESSSLPGESNRISEQSSRATQHAIANETILNNVSMKPTSVRWMQELNYYLLKKTTVSINVYDQQQKLFMHMAPEKKTSGLHALPLNTKSWPAGKYQLEVISGKITKSINFIVP